MADISTNDILEALIAVSDDKIWASELALVFDRTDRRIDFWTLEPIRSKQFRAQAYEIKISRADFKRDSLEKQSGALQFANRFWYVTPPALLDKKEIPEWAGLIEWNGKSFSVKKKAPPRDKAEPTWPFVVSLMRNCAESRRDSGLMKVQLAFYEQQAERARREQKLRNEIWMERQINRWRQKQGAAA